MTDARGNTWRYAYDRNGQLVSTTDPVGGVSSTEYNSVGRAASVKDANGNTTQYTYDASATLQRSPMHSARAPSANTMPTVI